MLECIGVLFMGTAKIMAQGELSHDWKKNQTNFYDKRLKMKKEFMTVFVKRRKKEKYFWHANGYCVCSWDVLDTHCCPCSVINCSNVTHVTLHSKSNCRVWAHWRASPSPFSAVRSRRFPVRRGALGQPWSQLPTSSESLQLVFSAWQ